MRKTLVGVAPARVRTFGARLVTLPLLGETFAFEGVAFQGEKNFNWLALAIFCQAFQTKHLVGIANSQIEDLLP